MKKATKIMGICAGAMIAAGILLMLIGKLAGAKDYIVVDYDNGFRVEAYNYEDAQRKTFVADTEITDIDISVNLGNIVIKEGSEFCVEYYEGGISNCQCEIKDKTLVVRCNQRAAIHMGSFGIFTSDNYHSDVIVTIPKDYHINTMQLSTDLGDIKVEADCKRLEAVTHLGDVITDFQCENIVAESNLGNVEVTMSGVKAAQLDGWLETDLGSVKINAYNDDMAKELSRKSGSSIELNATKLPKIYVELNSNLGNVIIDLK